VLALPKDPMWASSVVFFLFFLSLKIPSVVIHLCREGRVETWKPGSWEVCHGSSFPKAELLTCTPSSP
jgi:hypothetical protein